MLVCNRGRLRTSCRRAICNRDSQRAHRSGQSAGDSARHGRVAQRPDRSGGREIQSPADAWVIEGDGLTVYPGLIDALSTSEFPMALRKPPAVEVVDAVPPLLPRQPLQPPLPPSRAVPKIVPIRPVLGQRCRPVRPTDRRLDSARGAGFTTAVTFPTRGIFAGQGAVIDLAAKPPAT